MANKWVQAFLQLVAVGCCFYGLYSAYTLSSNVLSLIYNGLWFILGCASHLTGLISILTSMFEGDDAGATSHLILQYHYMCSWLTIVVGYPTLVTQFWMNYYPGLLAHVLVALSCIPMVAWAMQNNTVLVATTQMVTGIAIGAHAYICYLAWNLLGLIGSAIMIVNLTALSMPVRYNFLGFSSREAFIIGIASDSLLFAFAVSEMSNHPQVVKSLLPW